MRSRTRQRLDWVGVTALLYAIAVYLYLLLPNVIVALMSFDSDRYSTFPIQTWTLDWWRQMFANADMWSAFATSVEHGLVVAILTIALGTMTAMAIARVGGRIGVLLVLALAVILVVPTLVYGAALVTATAVFGVGLGLPVVAVGHVMIALPYVALTVVARLRALDTDLDSAAATLGATPIYRFRRVTLPLLMPALVAGGALAFALSFDEFNVAILTIGLRDTTLPLYVYSQAKLGVTPDLSALATLTIVVSMLISILAYGNFQLRRRASVTVTA